MELLFNSRDGKEKFPGKREVDFSPKSRDPGTATLVHGYLVVDEYFRPGSVYTTLHLDG